MEANLNMSENKKDGMQLDSEYFIKHKIKIEPMFIWVSGTITCSQRVDHTRRIRRGILESDWNELEPSTHRLWQLPELSQRYGKRVLGGMELPVNVNVAIKSEVTESKSECIIPSIKEENEMNCNSTKYVDGVVKSEVLDIFEPFYQCDVPLIKEEL
ncbi:unnamed protein product, partial [Timema podura]|nr:unnamed protein product [Timema podura]